MNRLYKNLVNLLDQKIALYREFISVLRKEWKIVTEYSLERLEEIIKKKETLIFKLQALEESRVAVIRSLAESIGASPGDLTLKKLISARRDPLNPKLAESRKRLMEQIEIIRELNERNAVLIDRSSLSLEKSLAFIHRADEESMALYYANGRMRGSRMQSRILNADV